MRLESVYALKEELRSDYHAEAVEALLGAPDAAPVAVGVARGQGPDDYVLAVRSESAASAARIAEKAAGEAQIRIIRVVARVTPAYLQGAHRPLEPGLEISPSGSNWVGTLACIVKDHTGTLYGLSNAHVLSDMGRLPKGTPILQPFGGEAIGVLDRTVPTGPRGNLADAALCRLRRVAFAAGFHGMLGAIEGVRSITPDMLGAEVVKVGRTTGAEVGKITAVDIDGLSVAYGKGDVRDFDDQVEISGGTKSDFSAGGDSGSLILTRDGYAVALLFAGGNDSTGVDYTYACRIENVLQLAAVELVTGG